MDIGLLTEYFPEEDLKVIDQGRQEEFIQYLSSLGYLPLPAPGAEVSPGQIMDALKLFRNEYNQYRKELNFTPSHTSTYLEQFSCDSPDIAELELLKTSVSLDGELEIKELPQEGTVTIISRIIHYRLACLGLYAMNPSTPFSTDHLDQLTVFNHWLGNAYSYIELINKMGDMEVLRNFLQDNKDKFSFIVYLRTTVDTDKKPHVDHQTLSLTVNGRFDYKSLGPLFWVTASKERKEAALNFTDVEGCINNPRNRFLIFFIQLRLWTLGYYEGRIDGFAMDKTIAALSEMCDVFDIQEDEVVLELGKGYVAINFEYLSQRMFRTVDQEHASLENFPDIAGLEADLNTSNPVKLRTRLQKLWDDIMQVYKDMLQKGRKIYFGIRSVIKSVVTGFRKAVAWLVDKFLKVQAFFINLAKVLYREMREGLRAFADGLAFLVGSRVIVSGEVPSQVGVFSKFDLDMDLVTYIGDKTDAKCITSHMTMCMSSTGNLYFSLALTGKIIHWVVDVCTGPLGWARLGLQIGLLFRDLIQYNRGSNITT